ncbi:efflux RND transporter periplasmic adaptor subunit [Oceanispirochaeta crateris]|uniref:Efflux RND transporter periplasmic adaptor subunit n=1 Tax=Oceanispirochaeta crateris TaxID=2518645 RepID=A0A5C1QMC6_9SPIO|nr:efflux RND transporter periplasmic adaptor subunit [Oceanispirochaeta crateris]QEN08478.1 efflux RND transporter periplasmic adaptor subunit [Oceanispirochaeta crateris]
MEDIKNKKQARMMGIALIVLIVVVLGAMAFSVFGKDAPISGAPGGPGGRPGGDSGSEESVTYSVLVETMEPGIMENYLKFNGDVIAETSVDIYPDAAGKLTKLSVSLGDYVRKGQIIAEVDPSLPGQIYVASPVKSTISGIVTDLPYNVGATISTTQVPLATVGDLTNMQLDSFISEKDMASIKLRQRAEIGFAPFPGEVFSGFVSEISPVLNKSSRTMEIKISLENEDGRVKSGMFGSIKLITEKKEDVLTIPSESLIEGDDSRFVYIVSPDNTALQTFVETGLVLDGRVEVLSGLSAGDRVIVRGQTMLQDGSSVRVTE